MTVVEESSARADGPSRVVDLVTVLSGRALAPSNASADPGTHDFHRVLPTWWLVIDRQPFASKQALSSAGRLLRSHHGPYID